MRTHLINKKTGIDKPVSDYFNQIVRGTLSNLKNLRDAGHWTDGETDPPTETAVFKKVDALNSFFLARRINPKEFGNIQISDGQLTDDILFIINSVKKENFYPSPYSYHKTLKHQATDFAAILIPFSIEVRDYFKTRRGRKTKPPEKILEGLEEVISKSSNFLLESSKIRDSGRTRWAPTNITSFQKRTRGDVYSTSMAILGLASCLRDYPKVLSDIGETKKMINEACHWLIEREKGGILTGDEGKSRIKTCYTIWGLNAIFNSWEYVDPKVKEYSINILKKCVQNIADVISDAVQEDWHEVMIEGGILNYYDYRYNIGSVLKTFCIARGLPEVESKIVDEEYFKKIGDIVDRLIHNMDAKTYFWNTGKFTFVDTAIAIEGILYYAKYGSLTRFTVTETDIRYIIEHVLNEQSFKNVFYSSFMEKLRKGGG